MDCKLFLPFINAPGSQLAFGHVRGGGEFGRLWHKMGRLEKKQNSISDCVHVMQHLISGGKLVGLASI